MTPKSTNKQNYLIVKEHFLCVAFGLNLSLLGTRILRRKASKYDLYEFSAETARALVLAGDGQMSDAEAEGKAWNEMAAQVARAREAVLKADPKLVIPVPDGAKPMSVIEAFSAMAMSKFILSSATPGWMKPMVEAMKANLTAAAAVDAMGRAWAAAAESDPDALGALADVLDKGGLPATCGALMARTTPPSATVEAKALNSLSLKNPETSIISRGFRRSGLSDPKRLIASR